MIVDDRLETVLRTNVAGKTAARTQMRQLVDLLGPVPLAAWNRQHAAALQRIESLAEMLTDEECAAVLRSAPHRSAVLVYHFAQGGPRTASAAVSSASLTDEDWLAVIPRLPIQARGFVRHRPDLGEDVRKLLSRLGINDFLLPRPEVVEFPEEAVAGIATALPEQAATEPVTNPPSEPRRFDQPVAAPLPQAPAPHAEVTAEDGIGAIVRRIEAFRRKRESAPAEEPRGDGLAPLLPFGEEHHAPRKIPRSIDLRTDAEGRIVHASIDPPGMLIGSQLFTDAADAPVRCDATMAQAFRRRQPVDAGQISIEGAELVAGAWQADGTPVFSRDGGRFTGYLIRLRRPAAPAEQAHQTPMPPARSSASAEADRLRQLLHELRTPINAIQGFAEMIQSQVFGTTPHQYRAMAASIAADAAQMLAGFEEIERLVKLESRTLAIDPGTTDAAALVARLVEQVSPVLSARNVRLAVAMPPQPVPVAFAAEEIERSVWRLLSVIATTAAPGERITIALEQFAAFASLALTLPAALDKLDDAALFAPDAPVSAGPLAASALLGNGFALRLARAEFSAGGGSLRREAGRLVAGLPLAALDQSVQRQASA